ncbi:uncharacterized protein LOC110442529 [Mizuhopecten yessoensis]|uniref:Uncharacterized protein n=1 Tax=Mizuhopecten yessoensis TaxID=6573 RepID=A0A210PH07_MIZYE|nr:uncharacterized protein LOC110442529 [Mizuhopecten yessoensis]OWF35769.1 hypothetical protein KP79_PYT05192 [Mizuhopecten yessoensis]
MASCDEVFSPCGKNLFCAADNICRLTCEDIPGECKPPCEILTYVVILLMMVALCLTILSGGLCLYRASHKKIERVMAKYQLKDEKELEKALESSQNQPGMGNGGFDNISNNESTGGETVVVVV